MPSYDTRYQKVEAFVRQPSTRSIFIEPFSHRFVQADSPRRRKDKLHVLIKCLLHSPYFKNFIAIVWWTVTVKFETLCELIKSITGHVLPEKRWIPLVWYACFGDIQKSFRAYWGFNDIHLQRPRQTFASPTVVGLYERLASFSLQAGMTSFFHHVCGKNKSKNHSASYTEGSGWCGRDGGCIYLPLVLTVFYKNTKA
jgi:hypothetical protein